MATKRDLEQMEARRVEGAQLLKRKVPPAEVARRLGVSRQSVSNWERQLEEVNGAVGKLRAKPLGRRSRLDAAQCAALDSMLLKRAEHVPWPRDV